MIFRSQREFRVTFTARSIKSVFACAILTTVRYIVQCHSITPKHINRIGIQIMLISISLLVIHSTNLHQEKGYLLDFFLLCNDRLINTSLLKLLLKKIKEQFLALLYRFVLEAFIFQKTILSRFKCNNVNTLI